MLNISNIVETTKENSIIHDEDNYQIKILYYNDTNLNNEDNTDVILLTNLKCYYINFGKYYLCEIDITFENYFYELVDSIYIYSPIYGWFYTVYNKLLKVLINNTEVNVVKCSKLIVSNEYEIFDYISDNNNYSNLINIHVVQARCQNSMNLLDRIHRNCLKKYKFKTNDVVAIKAVAGSGKTTTLLDLAKIKPRKKILYLAFNKSLIQEIIIKKNKKKIKNLFPFTFDSLMRKIFIFKTGINDPDIFDLKSNNIEKFNSNFAIHPWKRTNVKKAIIKAFDNFCNQVEYNNIKEYIKNSDIQNKSSIWQEILIILWNKAVSYELITFSSIRKLVQINHWAKDYIDDKYNEIDIDEAQDFDPVMLEILLKDTLVPKLFVGDPLQAIYQFRGSINTFDYLPDNFMLIEFYSTFRIGNPACLEINELCNDCWMISRSNNNTIIEYNTIPDEKYTYLFRSWKGLLLSAKELNNIFIVNYEKRISEIKKQHEILQRFNFNILENEPDDEMPLFLKNLSFNELDELLNCIENNLVDEEDADCKLTTIHSYKGLEDDVIRIYDDLKIDIEETLYYVALTRGKKKIILDKEYGKVSSSIKVNTSNLDLPKYYTSEEGYSFKVNKVKKTGGKKEGKYIIHLTQPDNEIKKCLYSEPNINNAIETVVNYINLPFINVKCFKC